MNLPIEKLTTEEKLRIMEELWTDLTKDEKEFPSPDWHKDVLKFREKRIQSGQEEYEDWESAKKNLRKSLL